MKVIGIKFKDGGKIYYFAPQKNVTYEENMDVVVETAKSIEIAKVAFLPHDVPDETVTQPLKPVIRVATEKALAQRKKNLERKPEAMRIAAGARSYSISRRTAGWISASWSKTLPARSTSV